MGITIVALMLGAFVLVALQVEQERQAAEDSRRADSAIAAAFALEASVGGMQSGGRGFILTGGLDEFLEPWRTSRAAIPEQKERLFGALAGHDDQRLRAAEVVDRVSDWERFSEEQIALARRNPEAARAQVLAGQGQGIVDDIRARLARLRTEQSRVIQQRARDERRLEQRSLLVGAGLLGGIILLVAAFVTYLSRRAITPLKRVTRATAAVEEGDLGARVETTGILEVGQLSQSFNSMTAALASTRAELERQYAQVSERGDALEKQRAQLQDVLHQLAHEKEQVDAFFRFGESLLHEDTLEGRAGVVLHSVAEFCSSALATLYVATEEDTTTLYLVSTVGTPGESQPQILDTRRGGAGSAARERRLVAVEPGGDDEAGQAELHVPLALGSRLVGVLSLRRSAQRPFEHDEMVAVAHLAGQAAAALVGALALSWARQQATITQTVLDASPDGLALIDRDGRAVLLNPSMEHLLASLRLSAEGSLWERMLGAAETTADPDAFRESIRVLADDPEGEHLDEFSLVAEARTFQRYSAAVRDADGSLLGRVLVLRETTSEQDAQRLKDDLLGLVSHELRTPITSISGYAQLALSDTAEPPGARQRGYLEVVLRNAERLKRLFSDLLLLAQVDAGQLPLELAPVNLDTIVAHCVESARPEAATRRVALDVDAPDAVPILGDATRLGQLFDNLISNGLKFTPAGGTVRIALRSIGPMAEVTIRDTGVGVPESEIPHLFERFFRASTARETPGTGLGLAIGRAIVLGHAGEISLVSPPEGGTTVRVLLPTSPARSNGAAVVQEPGLYR
jgi:signal transduction histidine kinase/CHASE3 domain sensor protein